MLEDRRWLSGYIWIETVLYSLDPLNDTHKFTGNISKFFSIKEDSCRLVSSAHGMVFPLKFLVAFCSGWGNFSTKCCNTGPSDFRPWDLWTGPKKNQLLPKVCWCQRKSLWDVCQHPRVKLEYGRAAPVWHPLQYMVYCEDISACLGFSCRCLLFYGAEDGTQGFMCVPQGPYYWTTLLP